MGVKSEDCEVVCALCDTEFTKLKINSCASFQSLPFGLGQTFRGFLIVLIRKNLVWFGFWVMFPSHKTQNFE